MTCTICEERIPRGFTYYASAFKLRDHMKPLVVCEACRAKMVRLARCKLEAKIRL